VRWCGQPDHSGQIDALDAVGGPRTAIRAGLDLGEEVHGSSPMSTPHGEKDLQDAHSKTRALTRFDNLAHNI
jgi:hypothetical protein